jgi:PAS domain S-box-containing protein
MTKAVVLQVDDYPPALYARGKVLRQAGFEVIDATGGEEALRLAAEHRPAVVLLDVNLPDMSGFDVCRRLKADPATARTQVVHLTAETTRRQDYARALELGADGYLVEPVEPEVLVATLRAVLRTRRAEEEARAAERQWQATFDAISDGICLVDRRGRIVRANAPFRALVGDARDVRGERAADVLRALLGGALAPEHLEAMLAAPERAVVEAPAGDRWLQLTTEPVRDDAGRVEGMVCLIADISERKRVEAARGELLAMEQAARLEAEDANRTKDEFLAVLSHELRTPLMSMLGWLRMLTSGKLDAERAAHGLRVIERNTRQQVQIIEDLLDISRIVAGKMRLEIALVALAPVIDAAVEATRAAAAAKGMVVETCVAEDLPRVFADPGRLEQAIGNLLSNAVKFGRPGETVRVEAARAAEQIRIRVVDHGRGIDPALLPHIFDRFRQGEGSSRRTHAGLGLGLAIVRHIVELHGGTVEAASEGPERGACFTITLPVGLGVGGDSPPQPWERGDGAARELPALDGVRILVVEDDGDTRELLASMLRQAGAHVLAVATAADGLTAIHRRPPDVLVSDIGMPEADGYDLIRAVRRLPAEAGGRTPAIALTAFAHATDRREALAAGYDRHLTKPVEPRILAATIAQLARPA